MLLLLKEQQLTPPPNLQHYQNLLSKTQLKKPISEAPKPEEPTASAGPKISEEKLARAGISKADPNERKYRGSRNNKNSKAEQVTQTEQPEPEEVVEEQSKQEVKKQTIVKQNPALITLTEADIDKYVPFLYKAAARGYFNKYKDEQGTLTLVVNEKMIDDNVPAIFRSTAKKAYKEYSADHPIEN